MITKPFSSSNLVGSITPLAPLLTALSKIPAASSTVKATSLTPSPCLARWALNSSWPVGFNAVLKANLTAPLETT